jgi:hypothetical protein
VVGVAADGAVALGVDDGDAPAADGWAVALGLAGSVAVDAVVAAAGAAASVFGVDVPDIPAAYAVMCARTSISFDRVASSSATALSAFELPLVPVAPGVAAPVVPLPTISVMILSMAATSVPQLLVDLPAAFGAVAVVSLDGDPILSSAERWRFNCASWVRLFAGTEAVAMLSTAALAWLRCSCGETA